MKLATHDLYDVLSQLKGN